VGQVPDLPSAPALVGNLRHDPPGSMLF